MAKISKEDIIHISQLSRIGIEEGEIAKFQADLENILSYVEQLNQVDVTGTEPIAQVSGLVNVATEDIAKPCEIDTKILLSNVPRLDQTAISVPSILEEG